MRCALSRARHTSVANEIRLRAPLPVRRSLTGAPAPFATTRYQSKKTALSERRIVKDQVDEATRYEAKFSELNALKVQFFLWQLFHINRSQNDAEHARREAGASVKAVSVDLSTTEGILSERRQARSLAQRALQKAAAVTRKCVRCRGVMFQSPFVRTHTCQPTCGAGRRSRSTRRSPNT